MVIYKITSPSNKIYIGQTTNFKKNKKIQWSWITYDNQVKGCWVSAKFYNDKYFSKNIIINGKYIISPNPTKMMNPYYMKFNLIEKFVNYIKSKS